MKNKLLILVFLASLLRACSWRIRFFIMNTGDNPINVEIKLNKSVASFPIFQYRRMYLHDAPNNKIKDEEKEVLVDTLEDLSHFKFILPAHTAVEIGELQNDNYKKYNQYFINGRVFNLESLVITSQGKETKIIPETFDTYFKKDRDVYYYAK